MSFQSDTSSDVVRRMKSPVVGQADIAAAVSGVVTTELFESVLNTEEDYSEDVLPEAAAEMGQGTYSTHKVYYISMFYVFIHGNATSLPQ